MCFFFILRALPFLLYKINISIVLLSHATLYLQVVSETLLILSSFPFPTYFLSLSSLHFFLITLSYSPFAVLPFALSTSSFFPIPLHYLSPSFASFNLSSLLFRYHRSPSHLPSFTFTSFYLSSVPLFVIDVSPSYPLLHISFSLSSSSFFCSLLPSIYFHYLSVPFITLLPPSSSIPSL